MLQLISPVRSTNYVRLSLFLLLSCITATSHAAISNENFDSQGLILVNASSQVIGDWTFSMDGSDQIATPDSSEQTQNLNSDGGGGDRSLLLNNADALIRVFTMASTDGSDFDIASMTFGLAQGSSATSVAFEGFRDGVSVVSSESVSLTSSDSIGNVYYGFTATTVGGSYGVITFQSAYDNVDEIRMTANNTAIMEIDDIVASVAISNTAPEMGGTPADDTATEDVATAIDLSAYNVSDADGDTITLTLGLDRGDIASTDGDGVTSGVTVANSGTASMTLQGTAANLNTYLNDTSKITYTTDSNDTTTATLTVTPNDGTENGTADTVSISISAVNDDPSATGVPTDITVTEDTQSNVVLGAMSFADVDSASITVTLTASAGVFATPADGAGVGGGVTEILVNATTMTLVGAQADISTYLDTASNIQYTAASNVSGGDQATITVTANDGAGSGDVNLGTVNIDVTPVNDDPSITGLPSDITVTEDTQSNVDLSATTFADIDGDTITVTLVASAGVFATPTDGAGVGAGVTETLVNATTTTLVGAASDINTYLDTASNIEYTAASNVSGGDQATITVTANDGAGSGDVNLGTVNIDVTPVNDDPSITGLPSDITVTEDTQSNIDLSAISFADVDGDSITVTFAASSGTYETPSDGSGIGGGVTETLVNATTIILVGAPTDINTYLDTASNIQYTGAANVSGNAAATITVTANDGAGSGDVLLSTVNINITAVVDVPLLTNLDGDSLIYIQSSAAILIDQGFDSVLSDPDSPDFGGGNLAVTMTSGEDAAEDRLSVDPTVTLGGLTAGSSVTVSGFIIGTLGNNITEGNDFVVNFNVNASIARVQTLIRGLTYENTDTSSPTTGARNVRITVNDGDGGTSANQDVTVTVQGIDNDGTLTSAGGVSEPVVISTTVDTVGEAVNVFDFTLTDGGTADGLAMTVSQIVVNVSGTASDTVRDQLTWRLNGNDASNVTGVYNAVANTITFSGLSISIADGASEIYTVNTYYNDNTGITEGNTIILSVDGDTDLTVGSGTQMAATSAVTNSSGTMTEVTATALAFTTQPAGSISGSALSTQPVVAAQDAFGNTDADFSETITVTEASAGSIASNTALASNGVASFGGLAYTATADQQSFTLTADDGGVGSDLSTVDSNAVTSDVVATTLVFDTQPAALNVVNGSATSFMTVPVVSARDGNNVVDTGYSTGVTLSEVNGAGSATISGTGDTDGSVATVTITPSSGVSTFTGMQITYSNSGTSSETFNLQASSGGLSAADSSQLTALPLPTISSATYAVSTGVLTVTGTGFVASAGNDVDVSTLTLTGEGVVSRNLSTSSDVEITSATTFSVTISGADKTAVDDLLNKNGTSSGDATTYNLAAADDFITAIIGGNSSDLTGNGVTVSGADTVAPRITSVVRQSPAVSPTNSDSLSWDVTFDEAITNVGVADFSVLGTTATIASVTNPSGNIYRVTVSGGDLAALNGTVTLGFTGGQDITDSVGNALTDLTPTGTNNNTFVVDNTAPGITSITRQSPATSPTNADSLVWDVTFDGDVANVNDADFSLAGSTAAVSSVTNPSGNTYRVTASGGDLASLNGTVTLSFAGGQDIADSVGNALTELTPAGANDNTFVLDNAGPGVSSITRQSPTTSPTNADVLVWDVAFDDAVSSISTADFSVSGTTAVVASASNPSGNVYRVTVSGGDLADLSDTVTLGFAVAQDITDGVGNALTNTVPTGANDNTFDVDNGAPSVSIASPTTDNTNTGPVTFTLTYSGADTVSLSETDITLDSTGDATGSVTVAGTGSTTRTVTISDIAGNGSLGISVGAETASDSGGNLALASDSSETFRVDNIAPTVDTVVAENVNLESSSTVYNAVVTYIDTTFNEMDFTSMGVADITVTGPGGTLTVASVDAPSVGSDSPQNASYTLTPPGGTWDADDNGTYTIALVASQVSDAAGNFVESNTEIATFDVDVVAPTLTISLDDSDLVDGETAVVSFTFSEAPVDFIEDDISIIENGTLSDFSVDGDDDVLYTATFTPTVELSDATNVISVLGSSYTDELGNTGGDANSPNYIITSNSADALDEVSSAAGMGDASAVTIQDLNDITGVSGATEENEDAYRAAIEAAGAEGVDTAEEIQTLVDTVNTQEAAINVLEGAAGTANNVTAEQLNAVTGADGALEENEDAYQAVIESSAPEDLDTAEEIQALVTQVNAIRVVETAAGSANTLTSTQLNEIEGVDAAIESNESAYQAAIENSASEDLDTAEEIQALLVSVNAQSEVEVAAESNDASGVTADDLNNIAGVSSASSENESFYQSAIAAASSEDVDSAEEIQTVINTINAERVIALSAGNSGTTEPTLEDYSAAGVSGVTEQVLVLINTAVAQQTSPSDVDETPEIDALLATIMEAQDDDGDGLPNLLEGDGDLDGDGIADRDDIDSDNDGVADSLESRLDQEDSDGDGIIDVLDADVLSADPAVAKGVTERFTKGDGIVDEGKADENLDGVDDNVDTFAELIMVLIDADFDGDTKPNHLDLDSDNDSLLDIEEAGLSDIDENGLLDDGDTVISDSDDLPNTDGDEQPNFVDLNSDGSSNDLQIQSLDTDNDGVLDSTIDMDNDGVIDTVDGAVGAFGSLPDADGDGIANAFDEDDDNDGIPDTEENPRQAVFTGLDADADGIDDGVDAEVNGVLFGSDADENGVQDTLELADFDNDGIADHLDADSDNDGTSDDKDVAVSLGPDVKASRGGGGAMNVLTLFGFICIVSLKLLARFRGVLSKVLLVFIALTISIFVRAEDKPWQVGGALGIATIDPELSSALRVTDDRDTSLQFSLGYQFADRWLVEARYVDFGGATVNSVATVEFDAVALGVQYHWEAFKGKPISVYILGGFAAINSNSDQLSLEDDSSTDLMLGLGAGYEIERWYLFSEFTSYNKNLSGFVFGVKRFF